MKDSRPRSPPQPSHLFTVRLWAVNLDNSQAEWRGQVQHVMSGETYYFHDWPTLIMLLQAALSRIESPPRDEAL